MSKLAKSVTYVDAFQKCQNSIFQKKKCKMSYFVIFDFISRC